MSYVSSQHTMPDTMRSTIRRIPAVALLCLVSGVACGDLAGTSTLPAGTKSPNAYNTPEGALGMYRGVKADLNDDAVSKIVLSSGALTDELSYEGLGNGPGSIGAIGDVLDERVLGEGAEAPVNAGSNTFIGIRTYGPYTALQTVRGSAAQAIGMLQTYAPKLSPALTGEMYAVQGYADLLLAELYCSGVPLSTLDFQSDFTYQAGSSQTAVYQHAVTLFDSAAAISSDSPSVQWFAKVAKGRALLDLGQYADAAAAVAGVPDSARYVAPVEWSKGDQGFLAFFFYTVPNREGGNGLPFSANTDARVHVTASGKNQFGVQMYKPDKYPLNATTPVVLASGIEARLIEAEAALHAGDAQWLTILNTLRTTCTDVATCPTPAPVGTGGIAGLPPLSDPGTDTARVSLLFAERAYWLFLTGHRQGDLRRLIRNYGREEETVYPTGPYYGGFGSYGTDVTLPIPVAELANPLFHGCFDREA